MRSGATASRDFGEWTGYGLVTVLLVAVPVLLVALAWPRFLEGSALLSAQPAILARIYARQLSPSELATASQALARVPAGDGELTAWRGEFLALEANNDPIALGAARNILIAGLRSDPVNPRGWTLLCELDAQLSRSDAAGCLSTALDIAPFDWFVARRRSLLASYLWPELDADTQMIAAHQVWTVWDAHVGSYPTMREILYEVDREPHGPELLSKAFKDDRTGLRDLNRWLINALMFGVPRNPYGPP